MTQKSTICITEEQRKMLTILKMALNCKSYSNLLDILINDAREKYGEKIRALVVENA